MRFAVIYTTSEGSRYGIGPLTSEQFADQVADQARLIATSAEVVELTTVRDFRSFFAEEIGGAS
jgi:hypothetical protein